MVVELLVARRKAEDALAQQIDLAVGDQIGVARIVEHGVQSASEAQPPVGLPQEHQPAIAADVAPGETGFDFTTIKAWKIQKSLRTIWHSEFVC